MNHFNLYVSGIKAIFMKVLWFNGGCSLFEVFSSPCYSASTLFDRLFCNSCGGTYIAFSY